MLKIARHVNGISLNADLEYLMDKPEEEGGKVLRFHTRAEAIAYLHEQGVTEDELYYLYVVDGAGHRFWADSGNRYEPAYSHRPFTITHVD